MAIMKQAVNLQGACGGARSELCHDIYRKLWWRSLQSIPISVEQTKSKSGNYRAATGYGVAPTAYKAVAVVVSGVAGWRFRQPRGTRAGTKRRRLR